MNTLRDRATTSFTAGTSMHAQEAVWLDAITYSTHGTTVGINTATQRKGLRRMWCGRMRR
jgi:N-methylhydantoinase A/oxoprolinase/acetone carboxylase beta subunit